MALAVVAAGCDMAGGVAGEAAGGTTGGARRIGLAEFLGLPRPRKREFCAALSDTAPAFSRDGVGADVRDAAPMVERRTGPGERSTTHVLWPFFSSSRTPDERSFALRPIVAAESSPARKHVEVLWPIATYIRDGKDVTLKIRPLYMYKRRIRGGGPERKYDIDWMLVPILAGGRDSDEGAYFAFFPLAGVAKGLFGKQRLSFFLWPLWTSSRDKRYNSMNVMWPFAAYWKGWPHVEVRGAPREIEGELVKLGFSRRGGRHVWSAERGESEEPILGALSELGVPDADVEVMPDQTGRRLWPFFGGNHRAGRFDRRWYLWPLVSRWKVGLDTKAPGEALFVFPFYGRTRNYLLQDRPPASPAPIPPSDGSAEGSGSRESGRTDVTERKLLLAKTTWLFPFFHLFRQRRVEGKDHVRNLDEVQAPWPVLGYEKGEGLVARKLWPVLGQRKSNDFRKRFFLWRMYVRSLSHDEDAEYRWHNIGFFFVDQLDRWVEDEKGRRFPPRWPERMKKIDDPRIALGTHRPYKTLEGEVHSRRWTQLWPLWHYKREDDGRIAFQALSVLPRKAVGRAETLWRPFYTLYRYERDRTNGNRQSALLGLYRYASRRHTEERPGMRYVNVAGVTSYYRRTGIGKRWSLLGGLIGYERVGAKGSGDVRRAYRFLWAPFGRIPREVREKYEGRARMRVKR